MKSKIVAAAASVALLGGCTTTDSQGETFGAILGGVAGAVIGSQFGSGSGRVVATAVGTATGLYIGSRIGAMLDERQRQEVAAQTSTALGHARDGEVTTWSDPDTGASATIIATNTRTEERQIPVVRSRDVAPLPPIELIGETYAANGSANVRAAPTTDSAVTASLRPGERFTAVGKVAGQDWIVVAKDNRTIGYVYAPLVAPAPTNAAAMSASHDDSTGSQPASSPIRPAQDLDALMAEQGVDLDAQGLIVETVQATAQCRTAEITVTSDGRSETEQQNVCRAPDGAWEII